MKNIFKYILIFVMGGLVVSSCENIETNFDKMTNDYDKNSPTYYIQFLNATGSFVTAIDDNGQPIDISTIVGVALLGPPQSSDVVINLQVDPSSTLTSDMYSLESTSITIPAGGTSGSVDLTVFANEMPQEENLSLVINMDAGGAEASSAYQLNYSLFRIKFCPWPVDDMVGNYTGSDYNGYAASGSSGLSFSVAKMDDTHITVSGIGQHLYSVVWGEVVTGGDAVVFQVNPNGTLTFENQPLCTTDNVWDYFMGPSSETAEWDGCTMTFTIPWIWHWDDAYGDAYECESVFTKN